MRRATILRRLKGMGLTNFQIDVLMAAYSIPRGETISYKALAELAGHPNAYRAVGSVMRKNPMAPIIPCHRVIRSDGRLGSYSGGGTDVKRRMLISERAISEKRRA
ncbi:MAG: MGMT family protein [Candidatus Marsarchaeota archaeon]|nr:MGMT family protein [Candidatus Marsarchaeota archaeon]